MVVFTKAFFSDSKSEVEIKQKQLPIESKEEPECQPPIKLKKNKILLGRIKFMQLIFTGFFKTIKLVIHKRMHFSFQQMCLSHNVDCFLKSQLRKKRDRILLNKVFNAMKNLRTVIRKAAQKNYTFVKDSPKTNAQPKPELKKVPSAKFIKQTKVEPNKNSANLLKEDVKNFDLPIVEKEAPRPICKDVISSLKEDDKHDQLSLLMSQAFYSKKWKAFFK